MKFLTSLFTSMGVFGAFSIVILWIGLVIGWIMNIVKLFGLSFDTFSPELVIRIVGVVLAPIGGVVGWMG